MKKRNIALAAVGALGAAVGIKMLRRASTVNWEDVADQVEHSEHSRFIMLDGARVHYQEFGDARAPVIILIHGYTASVYAWKTSAPRLAERGFRVIAIDLLGFGYSAKPSWFDYTIESQARMVSRFMNRLGIGQATLVGSSYGGAVASVLALDYAERVERLVLVGAVCNDDAKSHPVLRLTKYRGVGEAITPFLTNSRLFLKRRMRNTLASANHNLITRDRIESIIRPLNAADGHRSLLATARNWQACRIEQDAHLITQPTLIIWGEEDKIIPIKNGYKLRDEILHSRMMVIRNCGHAPQEERPEAFVELVSEFCHNHPATTPGAGDC